LLNYVACVVRIDDVLVDSLLREAEPLDEKRTVEMGDERSRAAEDENIGDGLEPEERKLLSRYGVWLLVELTPAREDVHIVSLHCKYTGKNSVANYCSVSNIFNVKSFSQCHKLIITEVHGEFIFF